VAAPVACDEAAPSRRAVAAPEQSAGGGGTPARDARQSKPPCQASNTSTQAASIAPDDKAGAHGPVTSPHPRMILDNATLTALRQRAAAHVAEWRKLKSSCDSLIGGTVGYPAQENYPNPPNLGQGYQGSSYLPALLNEALCYQVLKSSNPSAAATYGAKAVDILMKMSAPHGAGSQGENPLTDDGFVIRFYGVGFGLGYDWLYDLLTPAQRTQVYTTANVWLKAFEDPKSKAAFEYQHSQSNYFAGYFHAKATIALGTYGENPEADNEWDDWLDNQFAKRVQPYYARHLAGGGWPEGFSSYAPLGILNMSLPIREVKTATGRDLLHAYSYPVDSADYAMHFTWPSRAYFDDRDTSHSNSSDLPPGTTQVGMFEQILGELVYWNSPRAAVFHQYINEVRAAISDHESADPWLLFLEVDSAAATAPLSSLPLSYFAPGLNAVAARSDWSTKASWMSFRAGPYVNNPGQGEEYFDQGSLALVRGASPLLVNAGGWTVRNPNGTAEENNIYADNYGDSNGTVYGGNRQLYNVFYVRNLSGTKVIDRYGQAAYTIEDDHVRTKVSAYEDGGNYVYILATNLEDMYRKFKAGPGVSAWSRQVVYLRPNRFVVYDRTTTGSAGYDQFLAWHFPANPRKGNAGTGQSRLDVSYDGNYVGAMTAVLPANAAITTAPLYPNSNPVKAWQVQVRPPDTKVSQRWVTVFDLSPSIAKVAAVSTITMTRGEAIGVRLTAADGNSVVVSSNDTAGHVITGVIGYTVPAASSQHVITDLKATTGYSIVVSTNGSTQQTITISPGGSYMSSAQGVLDFNVEADGAVQQVKPGMSTQSTGAPSAGGTPRSRAL
jgi:hypothetical protein